MCCLKNTS